MALILSPEDDGGTQVMNNLCVHVCECTCVWLENWLAAGNQRFQV